MMMMVIADKASSGSARLAVIATLQPIAVGLDASSVQLSPGAHLVTVKKSCGVVDDLAGR